MEKLSLGQLLEIVPGGDGFKRLVRNKIRESAVSSGRVPHTKIAHLAQKLGYDVSADSARGNQLNASTRYWTAALYYFYAFESPHPERQRAFNAVAEAVFAALWNKSAEEIYQEHAAGVTAPRADEGDGRGVGNVPVSASVQPKARWALGRIAREKSGLQDFFSFGLSEGQAAMEGQPVELLLEVFARPIPSETGYSVGLSSVEIKIDISNEKLCKVTFYESLEHGLEMEGGATVRVDGSGSDKFWRISAQKGVLDRAYVLKDSAIATLRPSSSPYTFDAEMYALLYNHILYGSDGKRLPANAKNRIIKRLLAKSQGNYDEFGRLSLDRHTYCIDVE